MGTQFKAQNLQHLTQMSQYLPLFTKKIKDPKAIKKQKATKEMDYTNKIAKPYMASGPNQMREQAPPEVLVSPRQVEKAAPQTERIIRDPGPRIVNRDQYEEITHKAKIMKKDAKNKIIMAEGSQIVDKILKQKDQSRSPQRKVPNNEDIFSVQPTIDRENKQLNHQLDEKRRELDVLTFKHAKAQAKFLQIMRELYKFRDEFNEQYSIRSKMLKVQEVTSQIDNLLNVKEQLMGHDEAILMKFTASEQLLSDPKSPQLNNKLGSLNDGGKMVGSQLRAIQIIGSTLTSMSLFSPKNLAQNDTRIMNISNILCTVVATVNKQKAECNITIWTQVSHQVYQHQFVKLTEKFDLWNEVKRLRFVVEEGNLKLECLKNQDERYIDTEGLYAFQERKMVVYIHGLPQRFISINLLPLINPAKKVLKFTLLDKDFNSSYCVVEGTEDRIFRDLFPQTYQNTRGYEQEIRSLIFKRSAVSVMIQRYIKQCLQAVLVGQDISENLIISQAKVSGEKYIIEPPQATVKYQFIAIIDREAFNIKMRQTEFAGLKVSPLLINQLNPGQGNSVSTPAQIMRRTQMMRKESSTATTSLLRSYLGLSNEVMHEAVINALNKKREFAQSEARGQGMMSGAGGKNSPSETPHKSSNKLGVQSLKDKNIIDQQDTSSYQKSSKMQQIMKLIQANSMYMQIHGELYIHNKDDFAAFLELVHNTDDDSLLLFIVDDPKDCYVKEVKLTKDLQEFEDWLLIEQRFGKNVEQLLCNIETIFRSTEFFNIVKHLVTQSREERNYYNNKVNQTILSEDEAGVSQKKSSTQLVEIQVPGQIRSGMSFRHRKDSNASKMQQAK